MPRQSIKQTFVFRYNYVVFLVGILLLLIGGAASLHVYGSKVPQVLDLVAVVIFVLGIWSLPQGKMLYMTGLAMLGVAILLNAVGVILDEGVARYLMLFFLTIFLCLTLYAATKHILLADEIDLNRLVGATCVYLLLGLIFGNVYFFLNAAIPGSFSGVSDGSFSGMLIELTYHSFVTLTTLGYGDINPVAPLARTLCYLEAVLGQIYLTILVAALVGIHIATRHSKRNKN